MECVHVSHLIRACLPWSITLETEEGEKTVQGLYRIDEAAFNALQGEALYRIHQAGALPLVYCQLLSMQHLHMLGKLTAAHARVKAQSQPATRAGELDLDFLNNHGTISFRPH